MELSAQTGPLGGFGGVLVFEDVESSGGKEGDVGNTIPVRITGGEAAFTPFPSPAKPCAWRYGCPCGCRSHRCRH